MFRNRGAQAKSRRNPRQPGLGLARALRHTDRFRLCHPL